MSTVSLTRNDSSKLVPLSELVTNYQGQPVIDAMTLHSVLEVKSRFNDWMPRMIEGADLIKGNEFFEFLSKTSNGGVGGRPTKRYMLTIEAAKEVALLQRTPLGKAYRRYLIDFEANGRHIIEQQTLKLDEQQALLDKLTSYDVLSTLDRAIIYNGQNIGVIDIDGQDYYLFADVARAVGYREASVKLREHIERFKRVKFTDALHAHAFPSIAVTLEELSNGEKRLTRRTKQREKLREFIKQEQRRNKVVVKQRPLITDNEARVGKLLELTSQAKQLGLDDVVGDLIELSLKEV